jgi:HNH endonuclease
MGGIIVARLIDRKVYPSFGECIYCGAKSQDVALSDEHIIPYSLGGNAYIKNASCLDCAKETTRIENELGRKVFWDFRAHIGEQTRRKKDRPTTLPFLASINGGPTQKFDVPISDHPLITPFPVWGLPGLLEGRPPTTEFEVIKAHTFHTLPPTIRQVLNLSKGDFADIHHPDYGSKINFPRFARAIAKIAYCQTVAHLGLHSFRHLVVPDLILGRYPFVPHLVGASFEEAPPVTDRSVKHVIGPIKVTYPPLHVIVTHVRLFSNSGTAEHGPPVYSVVVGAPPLTEGSARQFPIGENLLDT